MEINTATEDFTVKCSISYSLPVIPTLHFCMCSLAFPSSYKQPDIIKVNTQPTLIHIARSLRNCESSIVDTAYGSCCSFSCFSPLFFHLLFSFSLSLVWQPPLPVSSTQEFSSWVLRKLRRLKESLCFPCQSRLVRWLCLPVLQPRPDDGFIEFGNLPLQHWP